MKLAPVVGDTPVLTGSIGTSVVGATGVALVRRPDGTVITHDVDWVDEATGSWSFATVAGDLNQSGDYYLRVKVTFAGGAIQTFAVDDNAHDVMFPVLAPYAA